jgi:hypothetical protein
MWNQPRIGGFVTPALTRMDRRPGRPSVNAVTLGVVGSAKGLKIAVNQRRYVDPGLRDSAEYLSASGRRLDVADTNLQMSFVGFAASNEGASKLTVIADAAAADLTAKALPSCSPIFSVWWRNVSGFLPVSTGSRRASTPAATR